MPCNIGLTYPFRANVNGINYPIQWIYGMTPKIAHLSPIALPDKVEHSNWMCLGSLSLPNHKPTNFQDGPEKVK
ncbi:hypothetical protein GCM10022404_25500 [Celeribacter arenosi]|uniref:Uncharacterized protein n=1 Tax=Celeribacter arenosi TaxID=792649 RepID=A0ABP7KET4_9RHOB